MKKKLIYIAVIYVLIMSLSMQSAIAQYVVQAGVFNTNVPGKIEFRDTPSWSGLFTGKHEKGEKAFRSMEKSMAEICSVVTEVPVMNPPMGFNVKPYVSSFLVPQKYYDTLVPLMDVTFCDYPFFTLKGKHKMEQSDHWSSSMVVFENDPQWLIDENNDIEANCDSVGIPAFYYRPQMNKDKNDDWIIKPEKVIAVIHVIKKKGVPLYTPVTKEEYLDYKLKLAQKELVSLKRMLIDERKNSEKNPTDQEWKDDVHYTEDNITNTIKATREYQQALNSWKEDTLKAPAYTSVYYNPKKNGSYIDLVSPSYKGAVEFVRLNSRYFDKSLPADAPQLIMIGANYDLSATPQMKYEVKKWFDQIDYAKLQHMIH